MVTMEAQGMGAPDFGGIPEVSYWLEDLKETTRGEYSKVLKRFARWLAKDGGDLRGFLPVCKADPNRGELALRRYHNSLIAEQLAPLTANTHYQVIRSLLRFSGVSLRPCRRARAVTRYEGRRLYTQEEVRLMVEAAKNFRDKAIIAFLAQSGQRVGVLIAMRWGHVRAQMESGERIVIVDVPEYLEGPKGYNVNKGSTQYRFVLLGDAVRLIRKMMEQRSSWGEKIGDESPLFRSYNRARKIGGIQRVRRDRPGEALTAPGIEMIVKKAAEDAGVQRYIMTKLGKGIAQIHPHGFRRYFKHRMREAGVQDEALLDFLIGHKVAYDGAYDVFTPGYIRREVERAEPCLSLVPRQLSTKQDKLEILRTMARSLGIDIDPQVLERLKDGERGSTRH